MFSLIITIISIALVAALALATLYYGGDAFNQGRAGATASRLINDGQQVQGAVQLAAANGNLASTGETIATLVGKTYLSQVPSSFAGADSVNAASLTIVDQTVVTDEVCVEVQKRADSPSVTAAPTTQPTDQLYGCWDDSGVNTFFFNL